METEDIQTTNLTEYLADSLSQVRMTILRKGFAELNEISSVEQLQTLTNDVSSLENLIKKYYGWQWHENGYFTN